jgi:hypothetical protein
MDIKYIEKFWNGQIYWIKNSGNCLESVKSFIEKNDFFDEFLKKKTYDEMIKRQWWKFIENLSENLWKKNFKEKLKRNPRNEIK